MLCIASYNDYRKEFYEKIIRPNNLKYCLKHNIEYIDFTEGVSPIRNNFIWVKTFKISQLLETINENDLLISIDADIAIFDHEVEFNLSQGKSFSYSIDSANTHNMGFHLLKNNQFSQNLIRELIDENRYQKYINNQEILNNGETLSEFWKGFADQASWYSLAGIKRHSDTPFWELEGFGWNSRIDENTFFSKEDLYKNIELLPSRYNVTELWGETEGTYNINNVSYRKVINRHFAGQQKFKKIWYRNSKLLLHVYFWNPIRFLKLIYKNYFYRIIGKLKSILAK